MDAMTRKNTIRGKAIRLSDSIGRILDPPRGNARKTLDRMDNFPDSGTKSGQFRKRYLASTDEIIEQLTARADM
jgi:hypothetical protein